MTKTKTGSNTLSNEVQSDIDEMDATLKGIEKHLEPFFKASLKETKSNLTGLQIAKLNIVIAYSINTLFYSMFPFRSVSIVVGTNFIISVLKNTRNKPKRTSSNDRAGKPFFFFF